MPGCGGAVDDAVISRDRNLQQLAWLEIAIGITTFVAMPPTVIMRVGGAIGIPQPPPVPNMPTELRPTVPPGV